MLQSIEKKHKTKLTRAFITVVNSGEFVVLGSRNAFCAPVSVDLSLAASMWCEMGYFDAFEANLLLLPQGFDVLARTSLLRMRRQSIKYVAKQSAEAPMVRSACLVSGGNLNSRGPAVAFITTTTMTEQRRCEAA